MKGRSIAFAWGLALAMSMAGPAWAQKIIRVGKSPEPSTGSPIALFAASLAGRHISKPVRLRKYGQAASRKHRWPGIKFSGKGKKSGLHGFRVVAFALPEQALFPPYYDAVRPWVERPDMASWLRGGKTVEQGSLYASHIRGGRTVGQGSLYAGRIQGGKTVEGGSIYASRIDGGRTVAQGSRWASAMPNWRFSGYAPPMRPKGIPYYRAGRTPWASND